VTSFPQATTQDSTLRIYLPSPENPTMMESMRIRVKLAKLTGKGKDLDLLPSDTLKDLEKKVRDLDKIGDHVGIVFYLEGSQLTQDDDLRSKLHPDVLLRYYLTGPEIDDGTGRSLR
jgi:hypothetical protein